ncbi:MAG: endonuclease/exonuclease/phosphatase family protein [Armatimonadota bacterium]
MNPAVRLRVATFNIHGGRPARGPADLRAVARVIRELEADVVGLQEVHRWLPPPYVFRNQPRILASLTGMHVTFRPSFALGPLAYGNAILSRNRPERAARVRLPGRGEPRSLLHAELVLGSARFALLCTHLSLRPGERERQAASIREYRRRLERPSVLLADLNARSDSELVANLHPAPLPRPERGYPPTYPAENPEFCLDYILPSEEWEIERYEAVSTGVSDHLPVVAELVWRRPNG